MGMTKGRAGVLALLICLAGRPAAAQNELGSITGTIKDAQGAVLPGVTATAVNSATNVTTTTVTNAEGVYLLSALVNGTYRVTFTDRKSTRLNSSHWITSRMPSSA